MGAPSARHAIILSAGQGTRLGSLTERTPKVMLPIDNRPLLEHLMELVRSHGVEIVHLNLYHHGAVIEDHFGDGSRYGVQIEYLWLDHLIQPLESVARIGRHINERFLVLFGDVANQTNLRKMSELHHSTGATATLVCRDTDHPHDSDMVMQSDDNLVTEVLPKSEDRVAPNGALGNVGTYLMEPRALDFARISDHCDFFVDLFQPMLDHGERLAAYETTDFAMDIGTPERYAHAIKTFPRRPPHR